MAQSNKIHFGKIGDIKVGTMIVYTSDLGVQYNNGDIYLCLEKFREGGIKFLRFPGMDTYIGTNHLTYYKILCQP